MAHFYYAEVTTMEVIKELGKPKEYAPIIVGSTVGLVGMNYLVGQVKSWLGTQYPGNDWAVYLGLAGVTVAAVGLYLASRKPRAGDFVGETVYAASISAIAVGAFSLLAKGLAWTPITVGQIGATKAVTRPVTVVRKEPTTPTFAQPAQTAASITTPRF